MRKFNLTRGQEGLLITTLLLCVLVIVIGVLPMDKKLEENTKLLAEEEKIANTMKASVKDTASEEKYEKLKLENHLLFEKNYQGFDVKEKLKEILDTYDITVTSINSSEYGQLDEKSYEMNVAQPGTAEAYSRMQEVTGSSLMELFLVSRTHVTAEAQEDKFMQVVDAVNNIPPEGPGENEMLRYCMQITGLTVDRDNVSMEMDINLYGMKAPPD